MIRRARPSAGAVKTVSGGRLKHAAAAWAPAPAALANEPTTPPPAPAGITARNGARAFRKG